MICNAGTSSSRAKIDRRSFLGATSAGVPFLLGGPLPLLGAQTTSPEGLIERVREPQNLEFPFHSLNALLVPNERFYVRNHFAAPRVEARTWRLRVEGAVERELELTYDQLRELPTRTVTATLE